MNSQKIVTYSKLGSYGNLGNQLFEVAASIGIARKNGFDYIFPKWEVFNIPQGEVESNITIKEKDYSYNYIDLSEYKKVNLEGYFQSEKYWKHCEDEVRSYISFDGKENGCIAISVRQGDYVGNPNYELLPINYYYEALFTHFPDWKDRKIMIFSDDIDYCKLHFAALTNVEYVNGSPIEQLKKMSECSDFIIANSTFSWWGAYIANRGKVIRPSKYFAGDLLKYSTKDLWLDSWIEFWPSKYDLTDVTFVVPVKYDHKDRQENLNLSICMLQKYFNTNIIVMENDGNRFEYMKEYCRYERFDSKYFHRTKMINDMVKMSNTPIVVNWDADVFVPPLQMITAVSKIRDNSADFIFPYDGRFARVNREKWFKDLEKRLDCGIFKARMFSGMKPGDKPSVGGAVVMNKAKFIEAGMENENMISYAPEDKERNWRFRTLGHKVRHVNGVLYHMDHFISLDSSQKHNHYKLNEFEYKKEIKMNRFELNKYIKKWKWV